MSLWSDNKISPGVPTKVCKTCGEEKPITQFPQNNTGSGPKHDSINVFADGKTYSYIKYRNDCNECRRKGGPADSRKSSSIMKEMNMVTPPLGTPCACCGSTDHKLVFDHDHNIPSPNCFRGFICKPCNTTLGSMGDNLEGAMKFVHYLERYENRN